MEKLKLKILKGQESFRIKSFVKSNIWALLPAGKSKFKKGEIVDCFLPNHSNQTFIENLIFVVVKSIYN